MADREIKTLPLANALSADDLFVVQQGGEAKKVNTQLLRTEFGGAGGSGGAYKFAVIDGELICTYEGATPPAYSIDENGDLILTVSEGQTLNVGHVQGRNGKAGATPIIGGNGNWFIDGNDTGVVARGRNGTDGSPGRDGQDGTVIESISVSVDSEFSETPSCAVIEGGTEERRTYDLEFRGIRGRDGKDGTMTFEELTPEQREALRGDKGDPGKDGKDNLPTVVTVSGAEVALTLENNIEFHCTDAVTTLTLEGFTAATDGKASLWALQFTAGDGIAVTVPEAVKWAVATPVWTAGVTYWLSFVPLITGSVLGVWSSDE